ncbi:hypothetical protein [Granulicella cerasi]|nr:hypothetical protein [Granulicella cerasi]
MVSSKPQFEAPLYKCPYSSAARTATMHTMPVVLPTGHAAKMIFAGLLSHPTGVRRPSRRSASRAIVRVANAALLPPFFSPTIISLRAEHSVLGKAA